jgi:hypothetical protein
MHKKGEADASPFTLRTVVPIDCPLHLKEQRTYPNSVE